MEGTTLMEVIKKELSEPDFIRDGVEVACKGFSVGAMSSNET